MKLEDFITKETYIRKEIRFSLGTLEECENLFVEAFGLTDKTVKKFEMLPEYKEIIHWMHNNDGRGLFMTGSNGRGKSTILNGVLPLIFLARAKKILKPIPARDLKTDSLGWAICIDDVGQDGVVVDYGTRVDAVEYAISHCEDRMKLLIMTSNLDKKQIIERYGNRIMDRIDRLCKVVVFKGKSFRK